MIRVTFSFLVLMLEALGAIAAGLVILLGLLVWRVSEGPLPLDGIQPHLLAALGQLAAPYKVELGRTALDWGGDNTSLAIASRDVALYGPDGSLLAVVPQVEVGISLPALLMGRVAPTKITLVGPELRAVRSADETINLWLAGDNKDDQSPSVLARWVDGLANAPSDSSMYGALRGIDITAAKLTLRDDKIGMTWRMPRLDLSLQRDSAGIRGGVEMAVNLADSVSHISGRLFYERNLQAWRASLDMAEFNPAKLAQLAPSLAKLDQVNVPVSGRAQIAWKPMIGVTDLRVDMKAAKGQLTLGPDRVLDVASAHIAARLNRLEHRLTLSELAVDFGGPNVVVTGEVIRTGEADAAAAKVGLKVHVTGMKAAELPRYWPEEAAHGARSWVMKNVLAGEVPEAQAEVHLLVPLATPDAMQVEGVLGSLELKNISARYFADLPPITDAMGTANFDEGSFRIGVSAGKVAGLSIEQATVDLLGLDADAERADISVLLNGAVSDHLALINHKPLGYAQRFGLKPAEAKGTATTLAKFQFPLFSDLPIDDVAVAVASTLKDVALPKIVAGQDLSKGELALALDASKMTITGKGLVGVVPATFTWLEDFAGDTGSTIDFKGDLDEAGREQFSLAWPEVVQGSIAVEGRYQSANGKGLLSADLDLEKARVTLPWVSWRKDYGTALKGKVEATLVKGAITEVSRFDVSGKGARVSGKVGFAAGNAWQKVTLDRVDVPDSFVAGTIERTKDNGLKMAFKGKEVNMTDLFAEEPASAEPTLPPAVPPQPQSAVPEPLKPLDIRFDIGRVQTGAGREMQGAKGMLVRSVRGWHLLDITGRLAGGLPIVVKLVPNATGRWLHVESTDAGALFGTLQVTQKIHGGKVLIEGQGQGDGPVDATLTLTDFAHLKPETLRKIAEAAQPAGAEKLAQAEGVTFKRLKVKLAYDDDKIMINEGRLAGDLLGMSASGPIDLRRGQMNLQGTVVPLYGVNSLVSGIPVVGWLLTGGDGGGIFAATYTMKGPLSDPETSVNPLSILAPGFLRELFFQ